MPTNKKKGEIPSNYIDVSEASHIYVLPNLMTAGNLLCGFLAVIRCIQAKFAESMRISDEIVKEASMGNIGLALNRFYHALNISKMRRNIKIAGCDLNRYTEDYPELLSWAVGNRRQRLETEYRLLTADPQAAGQLALTGRNTDNYISDNDVKACSLVYWFVYQMPRKATGELIKVWGEGVAGVLGRQSDTEKVTVNHDTLKPDESIRKYYASGSRRKIL